MRLPLDAVPAPLRGGLEKQAERFADACARLGCGPDAADAAFLQETARVWACSELVANACIRDPGLLQRLRDGGLFRSNGAVACRERLRALLGDLPEDRADENELGNRLRRFRREEMTRIAWRDLAGRADLDETLEDLSELADVCVGEALKTLDAWQQREWGVPKTAVGAAQSLVVLGMGKLGARELNFSSDIDLIFVYPEDGPVAGSQGKTVGDYFLRLARRLIQALDAKTAEGFVFRVDMRLRPYGESGPLVLSLDAFEQYYETVGREWERYAMIKARPITAPSGAEDPQTGDQVMATLRPFVYRRYLDYGAFASLREMKALVARQVARKGQREDVKLGPGGIREVEFIGQAFQLIRGGHEPGLRQRGIRAVLETLRELDLMPAFAVDQLQAAYAFLRRTENRIQAYADQQTQALPRDAVGQARLAFAMGFADWEDFKRELDRHRDHVQAQFDRVFAAPQGEDGGEPENAELTVCWQEALDEDQAHQALTRNGFRRPQALYERLRGFRGGRSYRARSAQAQVRLDRLMPLLLAAAGAQDNADDCAQRLLTLIERIGGRSAYLALLVENPMALSQLVRLAAASPWIADHLGKHPVLLDELLDPRSLYCPMDIQGLRDDLDLRLSKIGAGDLEQELEALRQFKQAAVLRVAAADVTGARPLMKVSDALTDIAQVCLDKALELSWRDLRARFGQPGAFVDGKRRNPGFAVLGYGKLGGIELGYGSDLDLVFIHDSSGERQETDGAKSIDNATFFARLGQRLVHYLNTPTAAGILYEVDTRLRPSGHSGLLVTSLDAFERYQREKAWTWEHQALVRARCVAGDAVIGEALQAIRRRILAQERDSQTLRREVAEMRRRMREELGSKNAETFDLKQDPGGIADIEFMVQFGVLAWSAQHSALTEWTDTVRILDAFAEHGCMRPEDARFLQETYLALRARSHRLALQDCRAVVPADEFRDARAHITQHWNRLMGGADD